MTIGKSCILSLSLLMLYGAEENILIAWGFGGNHGIEGRILVYVYFRPNLSKHVAFSNHI